MLDHMRTTMILLLTVTSALAATACGSDDGATAEGAGSDREVTMEELADAAGLGGEFDRATMRQTLLDHGHDEQVAGCMAEGLTEQLLPYMYDEVIAAPNADEVPREWQGAYYFRLGLCEES